MFCSLFKSLISKRSISHIWLYKNGGILIHLWPIRGPCWQQNPFLQYFFPSYTVDKNFIGAPKMRNTKGYFNFRFSNIAIAVLDFSSLHSYWSWFSLLCFWYQFLASFLIYLSIVCRSFSLYSKIAKGFLLLFAKAFKSEKERQLLLLQ